MTSAYYKKTEGGFAKKAAHALLNNVVIEAFLVILLGICYVFATAADRVLNTHLRRSFTSWMQRISADRLNVLRRAQIRYVFKRKFGLKKIKIKLVGGSYWLSIPCLVRGIDRNTRQEKKYMAKIINDRSTLKHKYLTMMRNVGLLAEGRSLKFDEHTGPQEMGDFEGRCLLGIRESSANAPQVYGVHHLGGDDYVLVMEYIDGQPLSKMDIDGDLLDQLFKTLKSMHQGGIFHGDIKLDNFMYSKGSVFVFDCLKLDTKRSHEAAAFDLACLLCALAEKVPVSVIVEHAKRYFSPGELGDAAGMIDVALYKSDLELSDKKIHGLKEMLRITA